MQRYRIIYPVGYRPLISAQPGNSGIFTLKTSFADRRVYDLIDNALKGRGGSYGWHIVFSLLLL